MTDAEILTAVKERKSITGDYQDSALLGYIVDAIEILIDAGVSEQIVRSTASLGCITSCVTDMWDNVGGEADLSPLTHKRITQLVCRSRNEENTENTESAELVQQYSSHYSSYYVTTEDNETQIPINIPSYSIDEDILRVYINGFKLVEGAEYTKYEDHIVLNNPVISGTVIEFDVMDREAGAIIE